MSLSLPLSSPQFELPLGGRVLVYQQTDLWFLGDFLRHAAKRESFRERPDLRVDIATNASYLPLIDGSFGNSFDVNEVPSEKFSEYDLVVVPSSARPRAFERAIKQGLYTWDTGWMQTRYGRVVNEGGVSALNYFRAAQQRIPGFADDPFGPLQLYFRADEQQRAARGLAHLTSSRPIVVFNPTASNPFTRESSAPKEVDNRLGPELQAGIVRQILAREPVEILVGSAIKPGDEVNREVVTNLRSMVGGAHVHDIYELADDWLVSLRGYAALLNDPRVIGSIGGGTGTNTHLAAMVGLPSLSIEHAVDDHMRANWADKAAFPMGSFRWRNPAFTVGIDAGSLDNADRADAIASSFLTHLRAVRGDWNALLEVPLDAFRARAKAALGLLEDNPRAALAAFDIALHSLRPAARPFYGNFADEIAFLMTTQPLSMTDDRMSLRALAASPWLQHCNADLVRDLLLDSNLEKLLRRALH